MTRHSAPAATAVDSGISVIDEALNRAGRESARHVLLARCDAQARMTAGRCIDAGMTPIPIAIKANIDVAGMVSSAGSPALADGAPADRDAPAVARLRAAGYVPIGHSNMTELAFSGLGLNPAYGTPDNPATPDRGRIPGGSSSGSAVSVALDIVPVAIGTDTGGSIRIPAAFCRLFGFKPTAAAVAREGVVPLSPTLDSVGIIGRTLGDCIRAFSAMRQDVPIPVRDGRARLRLGLIEDYVLAGADADVMSAYDAALARLSDAGVEIVRCPFPELEFLPQQMAAATFPGFEAHARFGGLLAERGDLMDPLVRQRIAAGSRMTSAAYRLLRQWREGFIALWSQRIGTLDALIMPTVPIVPPLLRDAADPDRFPALNALVLRNPTIVNLADGCALSMPCHAPGGLPVGLTIAQRRGADDHLLRVAAELADIISNTLGNRPVTRCQADDLLISS